MKDVFLDFYVIRLGMFFVSFVLVSGCFEVSLKTYEETKTLQVNRVESLPAISVANAEFSEIVNSEQKGGFIVSLSKISDLEVSVDYQVKGITATDDKDFVPIAGVLVFSAGEIQKAVLVKIIGDDVIEESESIEIVLSNPANATIERGVGAGLIFDDDIIAGNDSSTGSLPNIIVDDIALPEGDSGETLANLKVILSESSAQAVTFDYFLNDETAVVGQDYVATTGELIFNPGEIIKYISIPIIADDTVEPDESFSIVFQNAVNAVMTTNSVVVSIINDDLEPMVILTNPGPQVVDEESDFELSVLGRSTARIFVEGLPPGMVWDELNRKFLFHPDFTQGGNSWNIKMTAIDGSDTVSESFLVMVNDNIKPVAPVIVSSEDLPKQIKYVVKQVADDFLDSPGNAGREFLATITVPKAASASNKLPLKIIFHGENGTYTASGSGEFIISPHDPMNSFWTGYGNALPDLITLSNEVTNYTQRRVLHLLSYVRENYEGVDENRVYITGKSMGGTGAIYMAIKYGYHFSQVNGQILGTSPLTMPVKVGLYTGVWGSESIGLPNNSGMNVWHYNDSTRALLDTNNKYFRNMYFSTEHGKNDINVPFDTVVGKSPLTGVSYVEALQQQKIGHIMVWDQRGHSTSEGGATPLPTPWWWSPLGAESYLQRNLPFPAFSNCSADDEVGVVVGVGEYSGSDRGVLNRYLRWDSAKIVDSIERLSMPIRVDVDTSGEPDPALPAIGNKYYGPLPITTDVTIRRVQKFQLLPGEAVLWQYGAQSGETFANDDGSVTIVNVAVDQAFVPLELTRK